MQAGTSSTARFEPPMPARDAKRLPKRELLELVKPYMRIHDQERGEGDLSFDRDPYRDSRWSWIYEALDGKVGQARSEIDNEDELGHYWAPAYTELRVIENGWFKYEADVSYPRSIRRSEDVYTHGDKQQFRSKWLAERWIAKKKANYARYIERLIATGNYDAYGYDR